VDAPFPYYRAKARVEAALAASGVSCAILRPTIIFGGPDDILINNIAWALRRLPVFGVFGGPRCKIQPVFVEDLAALAVEQCGRTENAIINAIGPETFTFREFGRGRGAHARTAPVAPARAGVCRDACRLGDRKNSERYFSSAGRNPYDARGPVACADAADGSDTPDRMDARACG